MYQSFFVTRPKVCKKQQQRMLAGSTNRPSYPPPRYDRRYAPAILSYTFALSVAKEIDTPRQSRQRLGHCSASTTNKFNLSGAALVFERKKTWKKYSTTVPRKKRPAHFSNKTRVCALEWWKNVRTCVRSSTILVMPRCTHTGSFCLMPTI